MALSQRTQCTPLGCKSTSRQPRLVARLSSGGSSARSRLPRRSAGLNVTNSLYGARLPNRAGASAAHQGSPRSQLQHQAWSPYRPGPKPAGPHIAASLSVRGRRIIITAALAGVADSPAGSSSPSPSSGAAAAAAAAAAVLADPVKANQELITGQLGNGLRYVLLPNPSPPQRFEAHLEVHAGSVDEREHEQGVAHLVEHVTFLGSKRRESLLGTGARANAYTDFHHTVFHVHAPVRNAITNTDMLPQVLEALAEIAFEPQFMPTRIEKERKAVLAEAQMMNTIEYRIDCQLLTHLHAENNLGCRFPIGKTEQVKTWPYDTVQTFWRKWYFPANVTLYIVGDFDGRGTEQVVSLIEKFFGKFTEGRLEDHGEAAAALLTSGSSNGSSSSDGDGSAESSNGHAVAAEANGSSAGSNGSSNGQPPLPVTVLPETPPPSRVTSGSSRIGTGDSWADYVIPNGDESSVLGVGNMAVAQDGLKLRHPVRPPVIHRHGCGPMQPGEPQEVPVNIFRHPLLQDFMLTIFCKLPVVSLKSLGDLRYSFIVRILLSAFSFRINQRYVKADPPFISIGLDISDSGREGCAVSTLTITSQPAHWKGTVKVAVEEMRRLQRFGLTAGELERYIQATMRDSAQLAEQANSVPSINSLDFVMESLALGHTIMSHREAHEAMGVVAELITLDEVNAVARSMLSFSSDIGREQDLLDLAAQPDQEGLWARPGPTRATSVVACVPAYVGSSGDGVAVGGAHLDQVNRGGMGASGHLDADSINLEELEAANKQEEAALESMKAPPGTQEFHVTEAEILEVLACPDIEVEPPLDVMLPDHLVPPERLAADMQELQPRFIPLEGDLQRWVDSPAEAIEPALARPPTDPDTGITQRRLSNGLRINYRHTDNEPKAGLLRIVASGGRGSEPTTPGPGGIGSVGVGTRTLSEGGAMGDWSREEVEAFCIANLIHSVMDSNDEFLVVDIHFVSSNGGMTRAFELLHEVLAQPRWEETAFERSKMAYINAGASVGKSLERATCSKILAAMLGPDPRFRDPEPEALAALTLDGVRQALESRLHPTNLELTVAGDFDEAELEQLVLNYMGTLRPLAPAPTTEERMGAPIMFQDPPVSERHITWHLYDSDERAAAYIAGPAPCRWGPFGDREPLAPLARPISPPPPPATNPAAAAAATAARRRHPLYATITLQLLSEVVNSRLFTTVRDSLGLTYDVSFEITTYDRLRAGWFSVCVTSYPDKIHEALAASLAVLRDIEVSPITPRELMRAKRTLITRHETDLKDNNYWLGLLTHLQSPDVPYKRVECLRDLRTMYETATTDDLYDAYQHFDFSDEGVFTVVGTSGQAPPPPPDRERLDRMFGRSRGGGQQAAQQQAASVDWAGAFSKAFAAMQQQQQVAGSSATGQQQLQQQLLVQQQQQQQSPAAAAPQQQQQQPGQQQQKAPDPMAMLTALLAATQGKKLAEALHPDPQQQQQPAADHAPSDSSSSSNGSKQ